MKNDHFSNFFHDQSATPSLVFDFEIFWCLCLHYRGGGHRSKDEARQAVPRGVADLEGVLTCSLPNLDVETEWCGSWAFGDLFDEECQAHPPAWDPMLWRSSDDLARQGQVECSLAAL